MSKRLAITIAGAVSLGNYEAGVLYEILTAIAAHNTNENTSDDQKIYIDVITGASAGGMSATILAQKLLFESTALSGETSNALHDPWINDISLKAMLDLTEDDDPTHSIFSSQLIDAISKKYLTSRYENDPPSERIAHPSINKEKPLKFGLSLSNLNGIDYGLPTRTGDEFTYTRYQDEYRRDFAYSQASDVFGVWNDARNAALATGAFPFAFAVKALQRELAEFTNPVPSGFPKLDFRFSYTDGGVFQNEPLGMAKDFVDAIDKHQNSDSRFYLFIAPGTKDSSIASGDSLLTDRNANLVSTAKALVGAIFYQARFQDWITAEGVNQHVRLLNLRAQQLLDDFLSRKAQASVIGPAAKAFVELLRAQDPAKVTVTFEKTSLERLREQYSAGYKKLNGSAFGPSAAEAWIMSVFVLELAADLGTRDEMNIYAITAKESELAGSSLFAFAGFFDRNIRQHDYDVGRKKAWEFIDAQNKSTATSRLGPFNYILGPAPKRDEKYDEFAPWKLDESERILLRDRLLDRACLLLAEAGVGFIDRWVAVIFVIRPKVNAWLSL